MRNIFPVAHSGLSTYHSLKGIYCRVLRTCPLQWRPDFNVGLELRIRYSIIRGFSCSHKQLGLFILAIPNARTILLMWVWICTIQCQPSSLTSEFYRVLSRHSYLFGTLASTLGFRNTRISRAFNRHTASIPPPHHFSTPY